jgi:Haem-degrading
MVTLAEARKIIAAAEKKAEEIGQPMNIAVADAGGNLVSHVRMDGAWIGSIDISIKKAWTSRAFDISTLDLAGHSQSGHQFFGIHASNDGKVMIFAAAFRSSAAARSWAQSASAAARAIKTIASPKLAQRHSRLDSEPWISVIGDYRLPTKSLRAPAPCTASPDNRRTAHW